MPTHRTPPDPVPARAENVAHNSNPPTSPASVENFSPTPGPWVVNKIDGRLGPILYWITAGKDGPLLATINVYASGGPGSIDEAGSNARLIAAGPRMLTLLRELREADADAITAGREALENPGFDYSNPPESFKSGTARVGDCIVAEVHQADSPSCHVCGAEMVPTGYKCLSCKATTEPTWAGAQPGEVRRLVAFVDELEGGAR